MSFYNAITPGKKGLEIFPYLPIIFNDIVNNPVTLVSTPTGSGKTVGIPRYVAKNNMRIMVVLPRILLVDENYKLQKNVISPDLSIGFRAESRGEIKSSNDISFIVSQSLLNMILKKIENGKCAKMDFTDVLMIDEVHEGILSNSLIQALWTYCYSQGVQVPKLLLVSATLDESIYPGAKPFTYKADPKFKVIIEYHNKDYTTSDKTKFVDMTKIILDKVRIGINGIVLVFLPGAAEIDSIYNVLIENKNFVVVKLSRDEREGEATLSDLPPKGKIKIILSTPKSEAGITIDNLALVIDSMLEKSNINIPGSNESKLSLVFISKSSAIQRKGRVGRVMDGVVYRMCTERFYDNLPEQREKEIDRLPLEPIFLNLASKGLDAAKILNAKDNNKIILTKNKLLYLGLISNKDNIISITESGIFSSNIEMSIIELKALLWLFFKNNRKYLFHAIVISVFVDGQFEYIFNKPRKDSGLSDIENKKIMNNYLYSIIGRFLGEDEIGTIINIWDNFFRYSGRSNSTEEFVKRWGHKNGLNGNEIHKRLEKINQISLFIYNKYKIQLVEQEIKSTDFISILKIYSAVIYKNSITAKINKMGEKTKPMGIENKMKYEYKKTFSKNVENNDKYLIPLNIFHQDYSHNIIIGLPISEKLYNNINTEILYSDNVQIDTSIADEVAKKVDSTKQYTIEDTKEFEGIKTSIYDKIGYYPTVDDIQVSPLEKLRLKLLNLSLPKVEIAPDKFVDTEIGVLKKLENFIKKVSKTSISLVKVEDYDKEKLTPVEKLRQRLIRLQE